MLHVHIQVLEATLRMSMNDFQLNLTKGNPCRILVNTVRYDVVVSSSLFCFCPRPCNIQFLEIHVSARSTQSAGISLHAKQCFSSGCSTGDAYQNILAWPHQIEPLSMNVLKVGVTRGTYGTSVSTNRGRRGHR